MPTSVSKGGASSDKHSFQNKMQNIFRGHIDWKTLFNMKFDYSENDKSKIKIFSSNSVTLSIHVLSRPLSDSHFGY
jgi:hypothetical protein